MELPAGVNRRYASLAGCLLAALWCWVAFDRPYRFPSHIPWNIYSNGPQALPTSDIFGYPLVDSPAIRDICRKSKFNESITFICEDSPGDIAEVRNSVLTCVRYAIAAGAHIVIPEIIMEEDYDKENKGNRTELDYMFDTEHFVGSLGALCPKMRIYQKADEVLLGDKITGPVSLIPESLTKNLPVGQQSTEWYSAFHSWVSQYTDTASAKPVVIKLGRSFLQYPVAMEEEELANSFGKLLNFHSEIRNLAATTMLLLSMSFKERTDLLQPVLKNRYFGVHLSTINEPGASSAKVNQTSLFHYSDQSNLFLKQAADLKMPLLYVSSEDGSDLVQFIKDAKALNLTVATKFDLLKGFDRETLLDFTPDQRKMIDYLLLSRASQFAGVGHSGFAWNIALHRHQFAIQKNHLSGPQMLSDDLSQIYGTPKGYPAYPASMWP